MAKPEKEILIKQEDLDKWDEKKYKEFFLFIDFFYGKDGKLHATKEAVLAAQQYKMASPFFAEVLEKIDVPYNPKEPELWNYRKFFMKLQTYIRVIKNKIIKNPSVLLPSLAEEQLSKLHCAWMLPYYEKDGTPKKIVTLTTKPKELLTIDGSEISPGQKLINAIGKVADVYDMIADSISYDDIQRLDTKDKINALQKLSYLYTAMKKTPPKNMNFIKINTKTGGKEELENALLDFGNDEE